MVKICRPHSRAGGFSLHVPRVPRETRSTLGFTLPPAFAG